MSIAITAPQKFAFQDLVCIEIMLQFCAHNEATLFVEPDGGEDAELTFTAGGRPIRCEIQVKGAAGAIALADVAACLAHPPPRRVAPTLLERVISDPNRFALFVMSGRADDASAVYRGASTWHGEQHPVPRIKAADAAALLAAFAVIDAAGNDGGKLKAKRQAYNAAFAATANPATVREALRRTFIFDQVDEEGLERRCAEYLRRDHGIPSDRTASVLLQLRAAIGDAKAQRTDAFLALRSILARASPSPIRPSDYVARGDEDGLVEILSRDHVLLLSGTPRVGKSYTARFIAAEFMSHGFDVQEFTEVESAERFLLEPGTAPRLALLDDPIGGSEADAQSPRSLERLSKLIDRTRPQRKLLVAQGLEPLLATSRTLSLAEIITGKRRWRDIGDLEPAFLVSLWQALAAAYAVDAALVVRVTDALLTGELVLEPGCLEHLAANTDRLGAATPIVDVTRLAREDAAQLGQTLVACGLEDLAVSLAVATAPREPIRLVDLAYVRGSGGAGLPGKRTALGTMVTIGGPPIPPASAPAYDEPPELAIADQTGLDYLERRRLVTIDATPTVGFAHPFYRAAAETLLKSPTHHAAHAIGHAVGRGLFCQSPQTSRATARNLDWIFERLQARPAARAALVEQAIEGLRSFFPATRDLCFGFLVNRLSDLPIETQRELPRWIRSVMSVKLGDLEWRDDEAHLPYNVRLGIDYFDRVFRTVRRREVAAELALLDAPDGLVGPERAAAALRFMATSPGSMTLTMVGRLLSYDEAALRAEATKLWLSRPRTGDDEILDRIFADDHPSCALAALKGTVRGWEASTAERQARHLDGLVALAHNVAAAAAMLDFLVVFDREEHTGRHPPWPIFERLMPVVMAALPQNAVFIDARLFAVARSALRVLSPSALVALCDGWIDWLERNECSGRLPSEFSLGVVEILLQATATEPERREARVARLLAFAGTGAKIPFMADLIDHWALLRVDERATVFERLKSSRSDDRWLQAVALTRSDVPDEVVATLLPEGIDLSQPPTRLIDRVPTLLIEAAIHVYSGQPQPLWSLGTHHRGEAVWEPVVEIIGRRPDHPLFELAWDHLAYNGDGKRLASIVADLGAPSAERALGILLRLKVNCTGNFMPETWATLLRLAADADEHGRWLDRMADASPAILDDISDLRFWLSEVGDFRGMLGRLQNDFQPLEMARIAFGQPDAVNAPEMQDKAVKVLARLVRERPPLLFGTCDRLLRWLERVPVETVELLTLLSERRAAILAEREAIKQSMEQPDPPLDGWINP
jgi:hypothetical protein